jgi:hypothetical protein
MAVYYASTTDWALFIGPVTDSAAVTKLIERAEDDIDAYVGPYTLESNGRKFGAPKALLSSAGLLVRSASLR